MIIYSSDEEYENQNNEIIGFGKYQKYKDTKQKKNVPGEKKLKSTIKTKKPGNEYISKKNTNGREKAMITSSSDTDDCMEFIGNNSDSTDVGNWDTFVNEVLLEDNDDFEKNHEYMEAFTNSILNDDDGNEENICPESNMINNWVLVKFSTKKTVKHFVGIITSFSDQYPVIQYVRKVNNTKYKQQTVFTYPLVEDISILKDTVDIIKTLPQPEISRRGHIIFNFKFSSKYNVQ